MIIYNFMNIFRTGVNNFYCISTENFALRIIFIEMPIH